MSDNLYKYKNPINSRIARSPHFSAIMEKYEAFGKHMSARAFFNEYITKIDPNLKLSSWHLFVRSYNVAVAERAKEVITFSQDNNVKEIVLEERSMKNILLIGDATLAAIAANPDMLKQIPVERRIDFLFKAFDARTKRMRVALMKKDSDRKDSIYDDIMRGAQYGSIEEDEIKNVKQIRPPEVIAGDVFKTGPAEKKTEVVFNPADL
jgi:hypothetical protein